MSDVDDMISRIDLEIIKNNAVLEKTRSDKLQRQYRELTFEKKTGEPLL